jgi:hypothetical protein
LTLPDPLSITVGVGYNEDSFAPVWGSDGTSRKNKRPALVACTFQVKLHNVECHLDEPSNILDNNPSGVACSHNTKHFRPEVTVIFCAALLPCVTERLARYPSDHNVNFSEFVSGNILDISHAFD